MKLQERLLECGMRLVWLLELSVVKVVHSNKKRSPYDAHSRRGLVLGFHSALVTSGLP